MGLKRDCIVDNQVVLGEVQYSLNK